MDSVKEFYFIILCERICVSLARQRISSKRSNRLNAQTENFDYIEQTYNDKRKRDQSSAKRKKEKEKDKTMKQFNNTNTAVGGKESVYPYL